MKRCLLFYSIFLILLALPFTSKAQITLPDTSFVAQSVANAVKVYSNATGVHAHLYNGPEYYVIAKPYLEGHQFYEDKTLDNGSVYFDGAWFHDISMLYDVVQDELVTFHPGSGFSQKLIKDKIDTFLLKEQVFVRLDVDSTTASPMKSGFYKLLYDGGVKALVRQEKTVQEKVTINGLEGRYDITNKYYLFKDGTYHQVKSKRSVLRLLADEKKQLQKFSRTNNLKFKKQREQAIFKMVQHYDTLKE